MKKKKKKKKKKETVAKMKNLHLEEDVVDEDEDNEEEEDEDDDEEEDEKENSERKKKNGLSKGNLFLSHTKSYIKAKKSEVNPKKSLWMPFCRSIYSTICSQRIVAWVRKSSGVVCL
jgi:hypothetical protein